ncbi:MAG: hypothetical protein ACJ74Q_21835 [Pyrinomonadaceae bacterium]
MHAFAERQNSTYTVAPVNLSARRERQGFNRHPQSFVNDVPRHERAAAGVEVDGEAARTSATGFDLTRVPVTPSSVPSKPFVSSPTDEHEREADKAADEVMRPGGNVPRLSPLTSPSIQRQAVAPTGRTTPARVTTSDEYERYQAAQEKMERFRSDAPYFLHNYRPSTGRGFFDAMYYPPNLHITVKVGFYFRDSDLDWWRKNGRPDATDRDVTWTHAEEEAWRQRYLTDVSAKWTNEKFLLFCTRPWWENLTAQVSVRFMDVDKSAPEGLGLEKGDVKTHYDLIIKKIPKGASLQSYTSSPTGKSEKEGIAVLNSEGLTRARNESGNSQRSAVHESAHMLGLGDTYVPDDKPADTTTEAAHAALAKKEAGVDIPIKDDARLTSRGEELDSTDSVTFLEAMRKTTRIPEWALAPKPAAHVPYAPERINDAVAPRETIA